MATGRCPVKMISIFILIALALRSRFQIAAAVINGNTISNHRPDLSTIESDLSVKNDYHERVALDAVDMLDLATYALATYAMADHTARKLGRGFIDHKGHIALNILPWIQHLDILNEVTTLCLYYGMEDAIKHRMWNEVQFACYLATTKVAVIEIIKHSNDALQNYNRTDQLSSTLDPLDKVTSLGRDLTPSYHYKPDGEVVPIMNVYMTIMNAFKTFSYVDTHEIVRACIADPGPDWPASMMFSGQTVLRMVPPYLTYESVIQALVLLPKVMSRRRRFTEISIEFRDDEILLGTALLIAGKPKPAAATMNGSISTA